MPSKKVPVGKRKTKSPEQSAANGANGIAPESVYPSAADLLEMPHAYLIRIAEREDREKAIVAFMHVPRTRCRFSDNRYLVTREHIAVLQKAGIPFEDITDAT